MTTKSNEKDRPIKSSFTSGGQTFVTYASDWDLHKGTRKWNELTIQEQNKFLDEQFTLAGETQWDQAIESDLLKSHASGLRALIVYVFLSLKDFALIDADEVTDGDVAYGISESLNGLSIGKRLREYVDGEENNISVIPDEDLVFLSRIDEIDAPFDDFYKLKQFLKDSLKNCDEYADSPNLYIDQAQLIIDQMEKRQDEENSQANDIPKDEAKTKPNIFSKIYHSVFKSPEVKLTVSEIKKTINRCKQNVPDILFSDRLLNEVESISIEYASKSNETKKAISVESVRPRDLAMVYIARTVANLVTSGNFHIYRGLLKDEGKYLVKIAHYLMCELVKSGHITQEERQYYESDIQKCIKRAG